MTDEDRADAQESNNDFTPEEAIAESQGTIDWMSVAMESVVRITFAGLGGSMIGLSQERRLESMRVVSGAAAAAAARRKRSPSALTMSNLPRTWAISCMSFCIILETCRNTSPTRWIIEQIAENPESWHLKAPLPDMLSQISTPSAVQTVGDFTLGGAIAGIVSAVGRNIHLRQRLPSTLYRGPQRFFGLIPGISLGFAAGLLQASIDVGEQNLKSLQTQTRQSEPMLPGEPRNDPK